MHLSSKVITKLILVSILATSASFVIAMLVARYIPEIYEANSTQVKQQTILTKEQLDEAQRKIAEKITSLKKLERERTGKEAIQNMKYRAIYVSWLPWLLIPFLISIKYWKQGFILLAFPIILVFTGTFLVIEIIAFSIFLFLGYQLRERCKGKGVSS